MPTFWGLAGTAIVSRTETAMLAGTATVSATPTVYLSGTATVDRTSIAAWSAQGRRTATRVLLGPEGEDMVRVKGEVAINVDKGSPVATASFVLPDSRCAYFAAGSIATGGVRVEIRCRISTDLAKADTVVFRGLTEAAPNEGLTVPTATIQAAGEGADFLAEKGCLSLQAFSGVTRLGALKALAESCGIAPDRILGGEEWGLVRLPLDFSGLSPWELGQRFAEMEDSFIRIRDGNMEIIPARQVVGRTASPIFDFTPSNSLGLAEVPPNRPTTRYILNAVGLPEELFAGLVEVTTPKIAGGTDATGARFEIRTLTTTVNGVLVRERIEEWRDAAIPGVTPSAVAWRLWQLTETETEWVTVEVEGVTLRTARILEERKTVTGWYSPPCRSSDGHVWSDTTRHSDASATWRVTETSVTAYTYDSDTCLLTAKTTTRGGWYSPLEDGGEAYDGGVYRAGAAYAWIPETAVPPFEQVVETNAEESSDALSAVETEIVTSGWRVPVGSPVQTEAWGPKSGSRSRWSTVPGSGIVTEAIAEFYEDGSTAYRSEPKAGTLPVLQRAAGDVPQYRTTPLKLDAQADGASLATSPKVETIWGAETMDDLIRVARHRMRDEHSPRVTDSHPANPFLLQYHVVTETDPTRTLDAKQGYVEGYRLALDASTKGTLRQQTVICLPLPEYDPPAEAA